VRRSVVMPPLPVLRSALALGQQRPLRFMLSAAGGLCASVDVALFLCITV
jgi:hypothetical protein